MTRDELQALPSILNVPTAEKVLGIGRSLGYELVHTGEWPTPWCASASSSRFRRTIGLVAAVCRRASE